MRIAAIYDIHGNLPALESVIREVRQAGVEMVVVGGDVVPGPMPVETVACLLALETPVHFIHGNGETDVLAAAAGAPVDHVPEQVREVIRWTGDQLGADYLRVLADWPATLTLEIPALGDVLFCHATPRNDTDIFTRRTPAERLGEAFAGVDVPVVVCGHTHMQFDRSVGPVRVLNAGSVGMPFGEAGAYWLLIGPDLQLRRTAYDLETAADRIRATAYPQAQDFAARHILKPPSEAEMLDRFASVEMR